MSGATECPTKPKGRPRKNSYYPHNSVPTNPLANLSTSLTLPQTPTTADVPATPSHISPAAQTTAGQPTAGQHSRFNSEDESMEMHSDHSYDEENLSDSVGSPQRPDSPQISVTD